MKVSRYAQSIIDRVVIIQKILKFLLELQNLLPQSLLFIVIRNVITINTGLHVDILDHLHQKKLMILI